jgi:hypothetical protein
VAVPVLLAALAFAFARGGFDRSFAAGPILFVAPAMTPGIAVSAFRAFAFAVGRRGDFAAGPIFFVTPAVAVAVAFAACLDVAIPDTPRPWAFRVATAVPSTTVGAFFASPSVVAAATAMFSTTAATVFAAAATPMFSTATTVFVAAATFAIAFTAGFVRGWRRRRVGELPGCFGSRQGLAGRPGQARRMRAADRVRARDALTRQSVPADGLQSADDKDRGRPSEGGCSAGKSSTRAEGVDQQRRGDRRE